MGLKEKLGRLQKAMRGNLESFELQDGTRYYFDPEEAHKATFLYFAESMTADYRCVPRTEPPEVLAAVADAQDRGEALSLVMGDYSHLPIDLEALVERGEFVPRSLFSGRSYGDLDVLEGESG